MSKIFTISVLLTILIINSLKAEYTQYFDENTVPVEITPADTNNVSNFRIENGELVFDVIGGNWANVGPLININMPVEEARGEMLRFKVYSRTGSNFTAGVRATFIIDGNKVVFNGNNAGMQGLWNRDISPGGIELEYSCDSIIRGYELQYNGGNTFNGTIDDVLIEFGKGSDVIGKTVGIDNIEIGVAETEILSLSDTRIVKGENLELISSEEGEFYLTGWSRPVIELDELKRIVETKYGIKKEAKPGQSVSFSTGTLHPGVYNVSIVSGDIVLKTNEIVIAYPDDYVFDLKDNMLFGVKNAWVGSSKSRAYNKHYAVVAVEGSAYWNKMQQAENQYDFSSIDELLEDCAYTQKPVILKINVPTPEWIFDYVAHVGGLSPVDVDGNGGGITRRGSKAPQFWSPDYIAYYKKLLDALANHLEQSPNGKWMLGLRVNPMAFNEEAWFYSFNGKEMELAGITPDRSTWIPPRNPEYAIYEPKLEANDFEQAKSYFREIISYHQQVFHPIGKYTFLRPYLEVDADLNLDCSSFFENEYTVSMGTDANAGKNKPTNNRAQVFKKYTRDLKKGAFHEDTWASFKAEIWNAKHGREPNYNLIPRSAEMAIYWRQFLKLYEGVTMSAFGSTELYLLDTPAYQAAVDLFLKYAGGEMDVTKTQYAWMVFAEYTDWNLNPQLRNVGYWLSEDNTSKTKISTETAEDGDYRSFHLASLTGEETSLTVAPEFIQSHDGRAMVSVEWKAESGDAWELYIDGVKIGEAKSTSGGFVINSFEHAAVPEKLIIRKISGNPKFHIVEVAKLAADLNGQVSTSGISIDGCLEEDLEIGDTYQFTAIISPLNATDKSVSWSSSDSTVAKIDNTGLITAISEGSAIITVTTNDGDYTDECELKIAKPHISVSGVTMGDCPAGIQQAGDAFQLRAIVSPNDATEKTVTWSSSNTSVVTVDSTGLVKTHAAGNAFIRVTANDIDFYDECLFLVDDSGATDATVIQGQSNIKVYPNPVCGELFFEFPKAGNKKIIEIYSLTGKLLMTSSTFKSKFNLDIGNLIAESMMFVNITMDEITSTMKFVMR